MNAKKYTQPANFKPGSVLIKRRPEEQMFRWFAGPLALVNDNVQHTDQSFDGIARTARHIRRTEFREEK